MVMVVKRKSTTKRRPATKKRSSTKKRTTTKRRTVYKDAVTGKVIPKDIATSLSRQGFIGPQLPPGYMINPGEGFIGPQLPSF